MCEAGCFRLGRVIADRQGAAGQRRGEGRGARRAAVDRDEVCDEGGVGGCGAAEEEGPRDDDGGGGVAHHGAGEAGVPLVLPEAERLGAGAEEEDGAEGEPLGEARGGDESEGVGPGAAAAEETEGLGEEPGLGEGGAVGGEAEVDTERGLG